MEDRVWKDKQALITGASSGIGAATAMRLAREGMRTILVARRQDCLEEIAETIRVQGGKADILPVDLQSEGQRDELLKELKRRKDAGKIDVLINSAGFGWYGYGSDMPWDLARQMVEVNVSSAVQLTLDLLGGMLERGEGHVVHVGSVAGSIPSQGVALYAATKAFVDAFTTGLYRELRGTRVHVSVVRPGPVSTGFFQTASRLSGGRSLPTSRWGVAPQVVAERIWRLLQRPRRVVYVPTCLRVAPWVELTLGWLMDRLGPLALEGKVDLG
ncbi:MAG: SDR family NAD(P)-dependent oxidoreductase [Anaerolineales bacterium]|jgi:short-subunit dehydrogenase